MKIHGIPRIFRITTHRWEFHRSASTAPFPSPQSLPHHPRGERILVRVNRHSARFRIEFPASRKLSDTLPGRGGGWRGWSPGKGRWTRKAREKREQRERERERRNKRQKDWGTGWKSTEDPAQLFCTRRTPPSSFSTLPSARNSIFVSARVYTRFSLPRRQWKATLHRAPPVYIVYPPISADENELSSFERAEFVHRPSSDRLLLRARMATKTRLRATHRE